MPNYIDLDYLNEISDGDNDFLRELLESFLNQTPIMIMELQTFINLGDWDNVAKHAHKLKPTFEYVGLLEVRNKMAEIEAIVKSGGDKKQISILFSNSLAITNPALSEIKTTLNNLK